MEERHIFTGMQLLFEGRWVTQQAVIVENDRIKAIVPAEMIAHHLPATKHVFSETHYLIPGFIDLHVHGAAGHDVMDDSETSLQTISQTLAQEGITGFLATTMTAPPEMLEAVVTHLTQWAPTLSGAALLGIHLEGPFIAEAKKGAQLSGYAPNLELMKRWINAAENAIKIVTLAPELPEALALISFLHDKQIIASIGHTNATYDEGLAAIAAGCTEATHLFNAMRSIHQREPGVMMAILLSDKVNVELILDGSHLHPAMIELVLRLKSKDHILLVTDAMRAKCLGDGSYELGGQMVSVVKGKAHLPDGTLAGSTLRLPQAVKNMEAFGHCSLIDAIAMATLNPARVLGLHGRKGSIAVGKDADLVVLNKKFEVVRTLCAGKTIFRKKEIAD